MNEWLKNHLACPRDKQRLEFKEEKLFCPNQHEYPVFDGIPIMLVQEAEITHNYIGKTLEQVAANKGDKTNPENSAKQTNEVDEFVQNEIPYTSGILYL